MRSAERLSPQARASNVGPGTALGCIAAALLLTACAHTSLSSDAAPAPAPAPSATPATVAAPAAASAPSEVRAATPPVEIDPYVQRSYDSSVALLRAGRFDEAERGLRALAQSHPELAGVHANLGLIDRRAGRLEASAKELELAVKLSPTQPVYFNQLGITDRALGRFADARSAYERAIALDANYAAAVLNLGILSDLYLGDLPRALDLYTRYLALVPAGDPQVAKWVADVKNRLPKAAASPASAPASAATGTIAASPAASTPARKEKE